jgi:hypothetical protein
MQKENPALLEPLAAALEKPRELSARVLNYISGTYSVDADAIGLFLVEELPKLEDYEIDLILSPLFTPRLADQAEVAHLLDGESVPREQWPALIRELVSRPVRARLVTTDRVQHSVNLREVTIERYVHRLRLDATIPAAVLELLHRIVSRADRPILTAIARRGIWEGEGRSGIIARYFATAASRGTYVIGDALELLDLVESYKPVDLPDLIDRIPRRQQALHDEINAAGVKPFFSNRVQELHGGERDQRRQDDSRIAAKEAELAFLNRLEYLLSG